MKSICMAGVLLLSIACAQKHTAETPQGSTTAERKVQQETKTAADELKNEGKEIGDEMERRAQEIGQTDAAKHAAAGAREIGSAIKQGSGEAAEKAGVELQRAGQKLQKEAKQEETTTTTRH